MEKQKEYPAGDLVVIWKPSLCMHSERCWRGLPEVFKPREKPWVQPENADRETLIKQIDKCPSGALSYRLPGEQPAIDQDVLQIKVSRDGPLLVKGSVLIELPDGNTERREKAVALCRCGHSSNKPYCDGTHRKVNFKA